jgi:cytochrome c-type biogenesis protein CcmE
VNRSKQAQWNFDFLINSAMAMNNNNNNNNNLHHGGLLQNQSLKREVPLRTDIVITEIRQVHVSTGSVGSISRQEISAS